jgi:hypothetical protein
MRSRHFPDPPPPEVVSAVWVGGVRQVVVTFDVDLATPPGGFDLANWKLTYGGGTKSPSGASVDAPGSGNVITLQFDASPGVSQIAYDPPPFDVVGAGPGGTAAAGFTKAI